MRFEHRGAGVPFHPRRFPYFYGWIILGLSSLGTLMSIPGQTIGISVFTDSLMEVLSLNRVGISLAYLIGTVGSALVLSFAGRLLDRVGARLIGTLVILLLGSTLFGMAAVDGISSSVAAALPFLGAGAVGFAVITLGFFLLRFLGQGVLTLLSRNMAMKWFDRRRGIANAVIGTVVSFGFSYAPRFLNGLIESVGWRGAWRVMGLVLIFGFTALFLILARDNPYICGMKPDGSIHKPKAIKNRQPSTGDDFTLNEARRTLTFWAYALTLTLFSLFTTAMTFHVVSIFGEVGMNRTSAVAIFLPAALISLIVNFSASWASDRLPLKIFLMLEIFGLLVAMVSLVFLDNGIFLVLLIAGYGISGGLMNLLNTISWPRFFGIKHLGSISGFAMGLLVAGSAAGPYLFSLSLKYTGGYAAAALFSTGLGVAALILALVSSPPVRKEPARAG